jgi:hypothetical protein
MTRRVRFVTPEKVRLPLTHDDWIDVKQRLTIGEAREATSSFVGTYRTDGSRTPNMDILGMGLVLAYLIEWSFRDAEDRPVGVSLDTLKQLDIDSYREIEDAINAHVAAVEREDEAREKKVPATIAPASSPTS